MAGEERGDLVCLTPSPRSGACLSLPDRLFCAMGGPRVLLAVLWALGAAGATALRIGAFNIQSFGDSKVSDPACGGIIAQVRPGTRGGAAAGLPRVNLPHVTPYLPAPPPDPGWL